MCYNELSLFLHLSYDSVVYFAVMLRLKYVISALVVDLKTLPCMFDVATSLTWKWFTLSPQVLTLLKQLLFSYMQIASVWLTNVKLFHYFNLFFTYSDDMFIKIIN